MVRAGINSAETIGARAFCNWHLDCSGATSSKPHQLILLKVPLFFNMILFFLTMTDCCAMLSVMSHKQVQKKIRQIQRKLADLGPLRPGTLYERPNVCGKPGCRCKREKNPVLHGPYHYLSYTFEGKSHTEFVSQKEVPKVRQEIHNYERLVKLVKQLVKYNLQLAKLEKEAR